MAVSRGEGHAQLPVNFFGQFKCMPEEEQKIVEIEMVYYSHSNKADKLAIPNLFRLNGIPTRRKWKTW